VILATTLGDVFKEPIDLLFNSCMRNTIGSYRKSVGANEQIVVTFDARAQNVAFWDRLGGGYAQAWANRVAGYALGNMASVLPLQAADMIAYETFAHQCRREKGVEPEPGKNMAALLMGLQYGGGYLTEESLLEFAAHFNSAE
jgi:hypothetical protein